MKPQTLIPAALAVALAAACNRTPSPAPAESDSTPSERPSVVFQGFTDTIELEVVPAKPARSDRKAAGQPAAKAAPRQAAPAPAAKSEKIYVETEGAQGRVWGYVTMKGDRGTGTIHDWDENTLSVSVTRHGNELFAVDQNSRQYVFKIR